MSGRGKSLAWRLVLLGVLTVIIQIVVVSQLTIFGARADLTPLVVASVVRGSLAAAGFGFGIGLFSNLALVQTVGLSSLLLLGIGYAIGRFRELRDPQGALVPVIAGVAATAADRIGFSVMEFLLGRPVPLGWTLVFEVLGTVAVNAILALPVYALVRR
jgi:rod shape-determining protein MreD